MTIRLATLADETQLAELASEFAASPDWAVMGANRSRIAAFVRFGLDNLTTFVALDGERLIGFITLHAYAHQWNGETMAEEIAWYVTPSARRGLAGPRLLAAAEKWATTNGAIRFKMSAPTGSDVGKFLERRGFSALETAYVKTLSVS